MDVLILNKFLPEPTQIIFTHTTSNYNGFNISCNGLSDGEITFGITSGGLITIYLFY